jgi:predicted MFS family arabinose efflux permease
MFPAAIKATSIFICGTKVGLAISPPLCTALMLDFGWVAMFFVIDSIGFLTLLGWNILFSDLQKHKWVSEAELAYITKDRVEEEIEKAAAKKKLLHGDNGINCLDIFQSGQ